jgi:hypothetical protein
MESLALLVVVLLLGSILLALTALLFAVLYARGKASFRTAVIIWAVALVEALFLARGSLRGAAIQLVIGVIAGAIIFSARRRRAIA